MGLSPGLHSVKHYEKRLKRRMERRSKNALPATKRRRLILKQERTATQGARESLEGATYQSGMFFCIMFCIKTQEKILNLMRGS